MNQEVWYYPVCDYVFDKATAKTFKIVENDKALENCRKKEAIKLEVLGSQEGNMKENYKVFQTNMSNMLPNVRKTYISPYKLLYVIFYV